MISWFILLSFLVLSFVYSPWFFIGVGGTILWKLNHWYFYKSKPWRKVHFPMMRAYAAASGLETGTAEREERDFDVKKAIKIMLQTVNPKLNITHEELIRQECERYGQFYDKELITDYLTSEKDKFNQEKITGFLEEVQKRINPDKIDNGLLVRMAIAAVIEEQFSSEDRGEYMFEVFSGKAA